MKIIIIPVSFDGLLLNAASERFRCDWLLPYLGADKYNGTQKLDDYDVIIYQRAYLTHHTQQIIKRHQDKFQIFDICDPDWLFRRDLVKNVLDKVKLITTSTDALADDLRRISRVPVYVVPDRHELSFYHERKVHKNIKNPILVWFGFADNYHRINHLLPYIFQNRFELIAIAEKPVVCNRFFAWNLETVNRNIIEGDIVLNPLDAHGYKSNNKTVSAWLLGMPVAEIIEDIERFRDYNERVKESEKRWKEAREKYDIKLSAEELKTIINKELKL